MPAHDPSRSASSSRTTRRKFLTHTGVGVTVLLAGAGRARAASPTYPDWIPPSTKPPKRGGTMARASAWDPPVLDPRLTNSVGLFQIACLTYNRLVRYPFSDEAAHTADLTLKGDL